MPETGRENPYAVMSLFRFAEISHVVLGLSRLPSCFFSAWMNVLGFWTQITPGISFFDGEMGIFKDAIDKYCINAFRQ